MPPFSSARVTELAVHCVAAAHRQPAGAIGRAHATLRHERWLGSRDRRALLEAVTVQVRKGRLIDLIARDVLCEAPSDALLLEIGLGLVDLAPRRFAEDAVRAAIQALPEAERLGTRHGLGDWLAARFAADRDDADALLEALNQRAPLCVRANRLRGDRQALAERLAREGIKSRPARLARDGLVLEGHANVAALACFREGWFEVQDEGSQVLVELALAAGEPRVLDACAGAGGKTLALSSSLGGRGLIVACDVDAGRLAELDKRARRAGAANVTIVAAGRAAQLGRFDRVLVDAPCSGSGTLRREPDLRHRWTPGDLDAHPARQLAILERYAALCRPGGRVVYATCSVFRAENEAVVAAFLAAQPAFRAAEQLTLLPHTDGTDGFFAAALERD